ncbi:uncharacterized protein CXorf38-like [Mercenaria mercenaria]|uniref:uncharacterized protein CXorf38-like n=1 Tax=Mercenaria mercenaria TaxID=6596 RepID=UPI00234EF9CE|nr:uncharacterized protein CXorf38-like [Mercenaria mercenaria]
MSEELKKNLNKQSNRNWVRAALSLRYFKQGFERFVRNEVMGHHADILKRLQEEEGILSLHCGECTSDNLLPQHSVQKKCIQKNRKHYFCSEQFCRRHCPNKVCSYLYDYIVKAHSTNDPLWTNTDPSKWLTDYWELGKCFLSTFGYADKQSAADTDATGLLSIAINDTYIQERMDTDIESLAKVKNTRNIILHSASLSLEDDVVIKYIDEMIRVLQDRKAFASDATAKEAILHLNEIAWCDFDFYCPVKWEHDVY